MAGLDCTNPPGTTLENPNGTTRSNASGNDHHSEPRAGARGREGVFLTPERRLRRVSGAGEPDPPDAEGPRWGRSVHRSALVQRSDESVGLHVLVRSTDRAVFRDSS